MRLAHLLPLALPALVAQAPVDYAALQKDMDAAMASFKAERNHDKALAGIRAKGREAKGELKEACLVAELLVLAQTRGPLDALKGRILQEVPASSTAWKLEPGITPYLPSILGKEAEAYCKAMAEKGVPEVKGTLLASGMDDLLGEGKLDEAKALLARLQKEYPALAATKEAAASLEAELKTAVGQAAPAFSLPSLEDPKVVFTNATFKGKYLLVDFWGTWCGWCVKELPSTHKLYAKYKDKGLEILSLASDASPEKVMEFRKKPEYPMPWKHAFLGRGKQADPVMEAYGVKGFPTLFLIGPDGKIAAKGMDLRMEAFEKTLARFLDKK